MRVRCGLAGATQEQVAQFGASKLNENPTIASLVRLDAPVTRGERVALHLEHSEPETYLWFDPVSRTLVERRETTRVSWYATAGLFDNERTANGDNTWTAPADARDVALWVVVRDDRGGVAFAEYKVKVQ